MEGFLMSAQIVNFKEAKQRLDYERSKRDPKRLALVEQIARHHPQWGPEEIESLHRELWYWGE
jgi:hypothetical protein